MPTKAQDTLAAAAIIMDKALPYFASARSAMPIIWSKEVPTMGVDKDWRCYVNPDTVEKFAPKAIAFILQHELKHLLRKHAARAVDMGINQDSHKAWNICTDVEINGDIPHGMEFPKVNGKPFGLQAKQFGWPEAKLAEDYYGMMQGEAQSQDGNQSQQGQGEGQEQPGNGSPQDQPGQGKGKPSPGKGKGQDKGDAEPAFGGSCADGQERPWELDGDDADNPGLTDLEKTAKLIETAEAIREACKSRGSVPGEWERWAGSIIAPVVPWGRQLRHAACSGLSKCGIGQQTYRRIKENEDGVALPRHQRKDPVIAIVCDTSGSMGSGAGSPMQRALSEAIGICKHVGAVSIIWTDSACHLQTNVRRLSDVKAKGGGGTDMRCGIKFANELTNGKRPDIVITLTDGETPWDMPTPRIPHIACIIGNASGPAFGKIVRVPA